MAGRMSVIVGDHQVSGRCVNSTTRQSIWDAIINPTISLDASNGAQHFRNTTLLHTLSIHDRTFHAHIHTICVYKFHTS